MQVNRLSENPVLVGSDYKRACLFFDEIIPVIWPSAPEDETETYLIKYQAFQDALEAPFLKERLFGSRWRALIEGYTFLSTVHAVFLKMRRDHPDAINIWQLAALTHDFVLNNFQMYDEEYVSIFFPDVNALANRLLLGDPINTIVTELEEEKVIVDTYGHEGLDNTDDTVDVMLSNIEIIQCDHLSWEQIAEIRKDEEAITELRDLRRFMLDKMKGYSKSHVEDILSKAMDDHKNAAKKWGLATLPSSIHVDCEVSVITGILTAVGVIGFGAPLILAAAVGTIAPLAQALISIHKGRKAFLRDSKVRYLVRLANEADKAA